MWFSSKKAEVKQVEPEIVIDQNSQPGLVPTLARGLAQALRKDMADKTVINFRGEESVKRYFDKVKNAYSMQQFQFPPGIGRGFPSYPSEDANRIAEEAGNIDSLSREERQLCDDLTAQCERVGALPERLPDRERLREYDKLGSIIQEYEQKGMALYKAKKAFYYGKSESNGFGAESDALQYGGISRLRIYSDREPIKYAHDSIYLTSSDMTRRDLLGGWNEVREAIGGRSPIVSLDVSSDGFEKFQESKVFIQEVSLPGIKNGVATASSLLSSAIEKVLQAHQQEIKK